jgi:hypothetical protein
VLDALIPDLKSFSRAATPTSVHLSLKFSTARFRRTIRRPFSCQTVVFRRQPPPSRGSSCRSLCRNVFPCFNPSPFHRFPFVSGGNSGELDHERHLLLCFRPAHHLAPRARRAPAPDTAAARSRGVRAPAPSRWWSSAAVCLLCARLATSRQPSRPSPAPLWTACGLVPPPAGWTSPSRGPLPLPHEQQKVSTMATTFWSTARNKEEDDGIHGFATGL